MFIEMQCFGDEHERGRRRKSTEQSISIESKPIGVLFCTVDKECHRSSLLVISVYPEDSVSLRLSVVAHGTASSRRRRFPGARDQSHPYSLVSEPCAGHDIHQAAVFVCFASISLW